MVLFWHNTLSISLLLFQHLYRSIRHRISGCSSCLQNIIVIQPRTPIVYLPPVYEHRSFPVPTYTHNHIIFSFSESSPCYPYSAIVITSNNAIVVYNFLNPVFKLFVAYVYIQRVLHVSYYVWEFSIPDRLSISRL